MPKSIKSSHISSIDDYVIDYQRKFNSLYTEEVTSCVVFRQSERSKKSILGKLPSDLMDYIFDFLLPPSSPTMRMVLRDQINQAAWPQRLLQAKEQEDAKKHESKDISKSSVPKSLSLPEKNPRSVIFGAYNLLGQQVTIRRFIDVEAKRLEAYFDKQQKIMDQSANPHPSILRFLERVHDGSSFAAVFEDYQETLPSWLERRRLKSKFLTGCELLIITRMLVPGIWMTRTPYHGSICIENIVYSLNGQKQLCFKIADLSDKILSEEKANLPTGSASDVFCLGVVLYQIMDLDLDVTPEAILAEIKDEKTEHTPLWDKIFHALKNPNGVIRQRFKQYPEIIDCVLQMLAKNPSERPIAEKIYHNILTHLKINILDLNNPSIADEPFFPADACEQIGQIVHGNLEDLMAGYYQKALLMLERGFVYEGYHHLEHISNAGNAKAHYPLSRLLHNRVGFWKSEKKETRNAYAKLKDVLQKGADQGSKNAQELLTNVLLENGDHEKLLECEAKKMSFNAEALTDFALLYHADKPEERLLQAANKGSPVAQLYCGQLYRARIKADQYLREQADLSFAASLFAFVPNHKALLTRRSELRRSKVTDVKDTASRYQCRGLEVHVKPLPGEQLTATFLQLLRRFRIPDHDHLLPLLGVCAGLKSADGTTMSLSVVEPCLSYNSLPDFFSKLKHRGKSVELFAPWTRQLAAALEKLHACNLVHCKLTANSISVNEKQQLVLGDYDAICYGKEHPHAKVRRDSQKRLSDHFPPEKVYTMASDVYAFGLTLFEIATECQQPLYNWSSECPDDAKAIAELEATASNTRDFVKSHLPNFVPNTIRDLIIQCLHPEPSQRPSAKELVVQLAASTTDIVPEVLSASDSDKDISSQLYEAAKKILTSNPVYAPNVAALILKDDARYRNQTAIQQEHQEEQKGLAIPVYPPNTVPINRSLVFNRTVETYNLLFLLIDVADELADLHQSQAFHGNVSLEYVAVSEWDETSVSEAFIAACSASCIQATAPESIQSNHFSPASDVFQFGLMIAELYTGAWKEKDPQKTKDLDPKAQLARLTRIAANGYADLHAKIPIPLTHFAKVRLVDVMLRCLQLDHTKRPTIKEVAQQLRNIGSAMNKGDFKRDVKAERKAREAAQKTALSDHKAVTSSYRPG